MSEKCPFCSAENDAFTALEEGTTPSEGDVSLCFTCAATSVFTGQGLEVRPPTDAELAEFRLDARIVKAQTAIVRAKQ